MRTGDVINGYTLLEDFKVVGAGLSKWTFVERGGRHYFLKEFLSPTYPDDLAPGSDKTKAKKRARCAVFEAQHRDMQAALAPLSAYGGNLIVTLDFFRWGAKYYKVTEKVDAEDLSVEQIARMAFRHQLVLFKSVAHSLKILHDLRIVHGDLKPSNVLVKKTDFGFSGKLIDFDSSYLAGSPPAPDQIVGTINYYSPELLSYIQETGVTAAQLGVASDVFALGLIFTEFLTGAPPAFDTTRFGEPAVAVQEGERLSVGAGAPDSALAALIDRMMLADPAARPPIAEVHAALMSLRGPDEAPAAPAASGLRGKLVRGSAAKPDAPASTAKRSSGLRGKLVAPERTTDPSEVT